MPKIKVVNTETDETFEFKAGYGANLRQAALYNDAEVYKGLNKFLNCRGSGLCAKCVVEVEPMENVNPRTFFEKIHKLEDHQKLGCRVKVYGDITVKAAIADYPSQKAVLHFFSLLFQLNRRLKFVFLNCT